MALPDTYQEVEYIETTGTQFINTGLYVGNNIQVETKIAVNSISQPQIVFACYRTSGSDDLPNYYGLAAYQNRWYYGLNGSEGNGGTYSPTIGTEYVIVYNNANNYININGSDVLNCAGTTGYTGTTLGIAVRANRNLSGSFKYFYFKMYNKTTGAYERDFVPCYRKSDNVAGLYDIVNNVFYTNAGSGSFIVGPTPAQSGKIKKILLGTQQVRPAGISKSIDVRGKTLAQIQAEGWDITSWNGGYNLTSNGLTTTSSTNNGIELYTPITLTAGNKVTVNLTGSGTRADSNYSSILFGGVGTTYGNNTPVFVGAINTGSQGGATGFRYNGSLIGTGGPQSSGGDFEMTLTFDLKTGAATYTLAGAMNYTTSITLTSAQISGILNSTYFRFRIGIFASNNTAILKTATFKVE